MKVGIFSDLHGNLPAMERMLESLNDCDLLLCAGDLTGYGPFPNEVIDTIFEKKATSIAGNHDKFLFQTDFCNTDKLIEESVLQTKFIVSEKNLQRLKKLPPKISLTVDDHNVLLVHGSPWNPLDEYIYPYLEDFNRFHEVEHDVVILGHTHHSMIKYINSKVVLNPGSCGQARDSRGRANFVKWDTKGHNFQFHSIDYSKERLKNKLAQLNWNKDFVALFEPR